MLLAREIVEYLSRQLVNRLSQQLMDTPNPVATAEVIATVIDEDLAVEDQLNEEVRDLLDQYSDYMRNEGVSYQEMFRRIKNQLIQQRKVIRASGRDSGDGMKLSRDKVIDLSHKIVSVLRKQRDVRVKKEQNEARLEVVRVITEVLQTEDKVDREAKKKIRTIKREIPEGGDEWDVLHKRFYAEELKRLGIDLGAR